MIGSIFGAIGSVIGGLFKFKGKQVETVQEAVRTLQDVNSSDATRAQAAANALTAVYSNGSWSERTWRSLFMIVCVGMVVARWFGYAPEHLSPAEVEHLYTFLYIGIGGYLPLSSFDKWMKGFQIGKLLKDIIAKKVL